MQNLDTATAASGLDVPENDLGPLAWVLDELRKSLDTATKALRRYVRDAELARGSDLATVDSGQLRISRQQLHQAVGALEMVGFTGPATVLRSMESAVQKFVTRPDLCTDAAAIKIERASFALTGYLETLLAGKTQSPVALFVQYAEVQEIAGATRVHPADLWPYAWRWINVADTGVAPAAINPDTRSQFDKAALMVIKAFDAPSAGDLAKLCAAMAAPAEQTVDRQFTIFWRIAAGFFDAIAINSLVGDVYVKRTVSRILIQLASHTKGDMTVSDRLAQDLLFFCAQAQPKGMAPLLGEVRMAYGLAAHPPVSYTTSSYGQFDPALLVQARKRITMAKESWSGLSAGDMGKLRAVQDQFSLIVDSITKLLPSGQTLSAALMAVAESVAKSGKAPEPALGMEVATSILYLEAGFEDFDPNDPALAERVKHLASRVENARQGATNQPLEPWMEELYRRVSDRQTMGSVVGELKTSLADLEKSLDQFFRDPQDKKVLDNVPSRLAQMRGVLSVLGLDQAAHTVMRMRDSVEQIMVTEVDDVRARAAGTFDKLGNNLGSLGFLIDMLSYQPVLAKKLFVFDEQSGELKPLMGRVSTPIPLTERPVEGRVVADSPGVSKTSAVLATAAIAAAAAGVMLPASKSTPMPLAPAMVEDTADDDAELLDIFLEEAREVIANGQEAVTALESDPSNLADLTTLRRAFHTLKGSSRMVGLNTFGDAGWSLEQMLNAWLADQKPADENLRGTASQGLNGMARWVEDIAAGKAQPWSAAPFHASADSLRLHGLFLPLQLGDVADSESPHDMLNLPEVPSVASLTSDELAATPAPVAAAVSQPADMDFAFDLSLPELEAVAPQALKPQAASPEEVQAPFSLDLSEPSTMTVDDGLSFVDLGAPVNQPIAASADITEEELADEFADIFGEASVPDLPVVAAPEALDSADFEFDIGDEAAPPADELVSADEFAAFERAMQAQDAWFAAHSQPSAPSPAVEKTELTEISERADEAAATPADFSAFATQPMVFQPEPVAQPVGDLGFDLGRSVATSHVGSSATSAASLTGLGLLGVGALAATTLTAPDAAAAPTALATPPAPPVAAPVQPSSYSTSSATYTSDDQYKAIGPLRISLQLYNVYLNEADEWSRRLVTCLTEWSLEPSQPLPGDSVIFAHSLAGSSSTVGFTALAGLARTMENALQHVQNLSEDAGYSAHVYAADFVNAAEEIRRLLHQFAAGLLREPVPAVEEALARCLRAPEPAAEYHSMTASSAESSFVNLEEDTPSDQQNIAQPAIELVANDALKHTSTHGLLDHAPHAEIVQSGFSTLETNSSVTVIAAATAAAVATTLTATPAIHNLVAPEVKTPAAALPVEPAMDKESPAAPPAAPAVQTIFTPLGLTAPEVATRPVLGAVARRLSEQESEDEIDVLDALDPDLFPIFEEEALELFPQMSSALRQWTSRPTNTGARSEVLRGLHTLKGSARLAGAMRLGELAHRMETAIEHTPEDEASTAKIEPLTGLLDGMQANFDRLRHPQEAALVAMQSIVEPASTASMATKAPAAAAATAAILTALAPLRASSAAAASTVLAAPMVRTNSNQTVRVRSQLLDRLVNQAGEVMITRSRLEAELGQLRGSLGDLTGNLDKLRHQLRDIEVQSESQMQSRMALAKENNADFDPLEFDRFTRVQELTRMMAESVNDVATVQRSIQRTVEATEDDLVAQARQTRELQRDLLRTRMVEFEGLSERLYRVVRQAGKDAGKQVKLDIIGGSIEMDRGVLDRMTPAFEHLLRNCVAHGIETTEARVKAGKDASGQITISLHQEGNDISVEFRDDGAGLNLARIRERATAQGLLSNDKPVDDSEAANLIFTPGFTTATQITELSGRGIGMDVVRSEVVALGGRIETSTAAGRGTNFKLVMPLTTAVTQVVMLRIGNLSVGVPANLVEVVRRATPKELQAAYNTGTFDVAGEALPFFWSGALLQHSRASDAAPGKTIPVLVFRSAAQRIVAHVDEVLGNQEVVVKNLGPQLSRLPGLAGMSVLASGAVALIYNPVVLAAVYGAQARAMSADKAEPHVLANPATISAPHIPLVLVVDDSITVRRVTQRLLQREGYRVALAADGLLALERLAEELPSVVLTDIEMPRMDGFDLVRNLKADPRLAGLPIITITSRIAEKHREHAMALGVNHYLGKPYSEEELLSLIRHYTAVEMPV